MKNIELDAALEAVLFASGSPVAIQRLAEIFGVPEYSITDSAGRISERLKNEDSGISLVFIDESYQLCTKSEWADYVKKALELKKAPPLSKASLEVLAIVAYNNPATRSFIEMVRGVDSANIVTSLCEKGLITECGHLDAPGRPVLFTTTENFLRCFGLESLSQLPEASGINTGEPEQTLTSIIEGVPG